MRVRFGVISLAMSATLLSRGGAQGLNDGTTARFSLHGLVTDQDGGPIADADITVLQDSSPPRTFRSDSVGRWSALNLAASALTVRVRRFGFEPRTVPVTISRTEGRASVVIALQPAVKTLNGITILESDDGLDARLRAFRERQATNSFGHYIDRDAIERKRAQYVSEVLRPVPGVSVASSRRIGNAVRIRGCSPLLWLDGVRLPGAELDETVQPTDVAAIEVYNSFAGIPAQYFDRTATCGTILVWTRNR